MVFQKRLLEANTDLGKEGEQASLVIDETGDGDGDPLPRFAQGQRNGMKGAGRLKTVSIRSPISDWGFIPRLIKPLGYLQKDHIV